MKSILVKFTFLLSFLYTYAVAGDADIQLVSKLFTQKSDQIMTIVNNKSLDKATRNSKIIETVDPMFDFKLMGKLSLGKNAWRSLNDAKQEEFTKLYVERMKNSYSKKVDIYTDEKINITSATKEKANRIKLVTALVGNSGNTEVIYKFHKTKVPIEGKETWLVYDAVIVGVSIIKTDRSQFKQVLQSGNIDTLMEKMQVSKN